MYSAIDIGGSKTLIALFTTKGRLLKSLRFETPKDYQDFLKTLQKNYLSIGEETSDITRCVVGAPGKIDRKNGSVVIFGNLPWENVPLVKDVEAICKVPIAVENDANLAGLSEALLVRHAYNKVLYITVSTGIGGILIVDGKIKPEYEDMEPGQMTLEHEDKLQNWEDFASGRAIYEKYGKKASEIDDPGTWYAISRNIALGLINVIANLTPDVVIIGGGVGTYFDKYGDSLHEAMMLYTSELVSIPPLRKAIRAEDAVIYGCYEYANQLDE